MSQSFDAVDTRKQTQRERLVLSAAVVFAADGFHDATVAAIIADAGVSRPTFYESFGDKEQCLLAVLADANERLLDRARRELDGCAAASALPAGVRALLEFCRSEPAPAAVLVSHSLAGGDGALVERQRGIGALAALVEERGAGALEAPDVAAAEALAGIHRVLGARIRHGRPLDGELLADLLGWLESYRRPSVEHSWERFAPKLGQGASAVLRDSPFGRPSAGAAARSRDRAVQRDRLFFATGELATERGLTAATVTDITRRAGVGYRQFRRFFTDKQAAFIALHELGYRRLLAATSGAYFSRGSWPERTWDAGKTYTEFVACNPTVAAVGFLEPYALGGQPAKRMDEVLRIFTLFLYEGHAHLQPGLPRPTSVAFDAIAATIFEMGFQTVRAGEATQLPQLLAHASFLVLAPFIGLQESTAFIEGKLAEAPAAVGASH